MSIANLMKIHSGFLESFYTYRRVYGWMYRQSEGNKHSAGRNTAHATENAMVGNLLDFSSFK